MGMSKVSVIGNVGNDPEMKHVQSGDACLSFSVAANITVKREKVTVWYRCTMWGKRAEAIQQYLQKGKQVFVTGELNPRLYESNGKTNVSLDVRVDDLQLLGSKDDGHGQGGNQGQGGGGYAPAGGGQQRQKPAQQQQAPAQEEPPVDEGGGAGDDDLPF